VQEGPAGQPRVLFPDERRVRRDPILSALATDPGDGHATLDSQQWLSPGEHAALARPPVYVRGGGHFELILAPAAQRYLLEFLGSPDPISG
jgi:hypothetical protein